MRQIALILAGLALATVGHAQDKAGTLELSGASTFEEHLPDYPDAWTYDSEMKKPRLVNDFGFTYKTGEIKVVSKWTATTTPEVDTTASTSVEAGENAVYWNPNQFKVGVGWQYFAWGTADNKNPTDNLDPRDYTSTVNPEVKKLSVFALDTIWYPNDRWSVEAVVVPFEQQDKYPTDVQAGVQSGLVTLSGAVSTLSNGALAYDASGRTSLSNPGWSPSDAIVGTRISWRSSDLDASISYLYDWDQYYSPSVDLTTVVNTTYGVAMYVPGTISLTKSRVHRIGADAKAVVDRYGLWAEAVYNLTEDFQANNADGIRNPSVNYTLGIDSNFGPEDKFYANLQYYGEVVVNYDKSFLADYADGLPAATKVYDFAYMKEYYYRSLTQGLGLQAQGVLQGVTFNVRTPLCDDLITPSITGAYEVPLFYDETQETRYGSLAIKPQVDLMPLDSFHIKVGLDLYYSWVKSRGDSQVKLTTSDVVGTYTPSNNLYLLVSYTWNSTLKE